MRFKKIFIAGANGMLGTTLQKNIDTSEFLLTDLDTSDNIKFCDGGWSIGAFVKKNGTVLLASTANNIISNFEKNLQKQIGTFNNSFYLQDVKGITNANGTAITGSVDDEMWSADIGANLNVAGFGLTGYYYNAEGVGITMQGKDGYSALGKKRDSDGGYVQATYVLPTKTKVGASWGKNVIEGTRDREREATVVGAYHPLTKHLNLVAEYNHLTLEGADFATADKGKQKTMSLGAILFF
jgi:hypothetical protein